MMANKNHKKVKKPSASEQIEPAKDDGSSITDYAQLQSDELEALKAIYFDEFEEVEVKSAWNKSTDKAFRLTLKSFSNPDVYVVLSVRLTATYPKTAPVVSVDRYHEVREHSRAAIADLLVAKVKELIGTVMIFELSSTVQDILEDEVQHRADGEALPTLEQERAKQEAEIARTAEAKQIEDDKRLLLDKEEEERHLQQMVEEEMQRRNQQRKRNKMPALRKMTSDANQQDKAGARVGTLVTFDRDVRLLKNSVEYNFNMVENFTKFRIGPVTKVSTVTPVLLDDAVEAALILVVKSCRLTVSSATDKKRILALEDTLETIRSLPLQSNISRVLEFKIDQSNAEWEVTILNEYANRGNLADMLAMLETIPLPKVRSWMVDLLEATEFLHNHGLVHGGIHLQNILIDQNDNGVATVKLTDSGYQHVLHELKRPSNSVQARSVYWQPPELQSSSENARSSKRDKNQTSRKQQNSKDSSAEGDSRQLSTKLRDPSGPDIVTPTFLANLTRKTDIWSIGIVFLQMLFGSDTPDMYNSPIALMERQDLTLPLETMIRHLFANDPKKRPSAFDLIPSEFLRNDIPIFAEDLDTEYGDTSRGNFMQTKSRRRRSSLQTKLYSRYLNDWIENGRLGKGGFGEVVKARNKTDGRIYAIKKISSRMNDALSKILSEVMLLSRLNHPNVVRYYSAWPEEEYGEAESDVQTTTASTNTAHLLDNEAEFTFGHSTGGLDFISSSGYPKIVFGDSDEEEDEGDKNAIAIASDDSTSSDDDGDHIVHQRTQPVDLPLAKRTRTTSTISGRIAIKTTLYIQMEYCEKHTLRDLIRKGLYDNDDEIWRLLRDIVEGLAHIHSHGIIHRDLKPDNIFIDVTNDPKIGDFGLATSGQHTILNNAANERNEMDNNMTRSIGTAFYVAPELKSDNNDQYNEKVDMYSLGIIFFEMCCAMPTAMERAEIISRLRSKDIVLPTEFEKAENAVKCELIKSLVSHRPSDRPSSLELLRDGKIPVNVQDETVQQALRGLADSSSPYYHKMMEALFSMNSVRQVKDQVWDIEVQNSGIQNEPMMPIMQMLVKDKLIDIFQRHGAVEVQHQVIFPRSPYYTNERVVDMLNPAGTLVQLPYDLTLPGARALARSKPSSERSFTFGQVYRDVRNGSAPRANGAVDFDIVSNASLDPALKEAEVLKVLDEIVSEIPSLKMAQMCFHLNHSVILNVILDHCRITTSQRGSVKEVLSRLNIQDNTWVKVRNELRAPSFGIASTSLDDLAKFDFRDSVDKTISKLQAIIGEDEFRDKLQPTFTHLQAVLRFMKHFQVRSKAYVCPLSCYNEKFYKGGVLFQCLFESKKRDVLAAGGRYDSLIDEHKPRVGLVKFTGCRAVGMSLGWDRLVTSMVKLQKGQTKSGSFLKKSAVVLDEMQYSWPSRRCSVVVASFDSKTLRTAGLRVLAELWANDISAELAADASSLEELISRYRDEKHSWIIIIKNELVFGRADLKVKSLSTKQDTDISMDNLVSWLRGEIRDRDQREGHVERSRPSNRSHTIGSSTTVEQSSTGQPNVQILLAQHKGKKTNRGNVIESAQSRVQEHLASYGNAPVAAVETHDAVLELVRAARLSDPESWKKVVQGAPANDRSYIQNIQSMLLDFRNDYVENNTSRVAFIFNFRTGWIGMYDLSL